MSSKEIKLSGMAEVLWSEIKDKDVMMFSLPNQKVSQYCEPIMVEPSKLYLKTTVSAFLPALEATLGSDYLVELADKFIAVSRAS